MTASKATSTINGRSGWALTLLFCVVCCLAVESTAEGATVRDEFDAISYNGNNGTANWTSDWIEFGEADGPSAGFARVLSSGSCEAGNCIRLGYADGVNDYTGVDREANLSGATTATLTYEYQASSANLGFLRVEISTTGLPGSWTVLGLHDLGDGNIGGSASIDISAYISATTFVRFSGTNVDNNPLSNEPFRGFMHFDDIQISTDVPVVCPGGVVTTTVDSATGGSLRACIIWANGNPGVDTLNVPAGTYTLTIAGTGENAAATGDLDITDGIVINGKAGTATIIDANSIDRVFEVLDVSATFSNLTIRNGNVVGGGGGIAVSAAGSATLSTSTFSGNTASTDGGGISAAGTLVLTNATVSGNTANQGGGINCQGPCTLTNVTVTDNTAPSNGGGVRQRTGSGSITFLNTIVASNISGGNVDCDGNFASLFSNGNNLSSDASCDFSSAGDQQNTDPLLGPLQNNGGPTFTHDLLVGSTAIEGGTNTGCPATDQRGTARPDGALCDIGAVEGIAPVDVCPGGIVTTTADTGASSLRQCINYANGIPGTTIQFNIPGPGNRSAGADSWWGISPATPLPMVTAAATVIDGTTQTTNQGDTNSRGPEVEIDGAGAGAAANGLVIGITADGSTIRSLAIGNFSNNGILLLGDSNVVAGNYLGLSADGDTVAANNLSATNYLGGIRVESASNTIGGVTAADRNVISGNGFAGIELFGAGATGNMVYGNYVGIDATGVLARPNSQEGIDLELSSSNIIGGPAAGQRNILSGNGSDGIEIDGGDNNVVQGNYIGTDVTGTALIPNIRDGIDINENGGDGAMDNLIGGTGVNEGNLIRGNTLYGVSVRGVTVDNNAILGNRIYANVLLGIDLNDDGVTANDPLDADAGPNDLLNYPVIVAAPESAGTITAYFELDVAAGDYRVEFFINPSGAHASGNGGGEVFAGATTITHAGAGVELFSHAFAGSPGDIITATATEELAGPVYNSTSEFSTAFTATALVPFTARWPLDETSGVIASDIDAGNDGTYLNGVLLNQFAACTDTGNAVYFAGADDLVEVPHVADYLIDEGTVSFWVNADAILASPQGMFSKDSTNLDTGGHLTFTIEPGGDVQVRLQSTTTSFFVNSAPITPGTWFHVAFTWGPGGMALYIDAAAPVTDPYIGGLGATSGGSGNFEPIAFGAGTTVSDDLLVTPTTQFFAGYMDDVRIINRALTLPEIQTLAACTPSLRIVKRAFWPDGTPIPSGATIPSGVEFKYLLYVNNPGAAISDVTVGDVLDPVFVYQAGTIQADNSLADCAAVTCTPAEELAIFAAVDAAAVLTDAVDGDVASYTGASLSVDAGDGNIANLQLDINANEIWAILFAVKMP